MESRIEHQGRQEVGAWGAKYLGPRLVRGPEILVKRLVMDTVKRAGAL